MKKAKKKSVKKIASKAASKKSTKKVSKKKTTLNKMAKSITRSTKKMVDDVLLKLIGTRVLERAQQVSASLKKKGRED